MNYNYTNTIKMYINIKSFILNFIFVLALLLFNTQNTFATHVVGGVLEYTAMGPGSLPNSTRYKIRLKLWRDAAGNPWFPGSAYIECRGDTLLGYDPVLKGGIDSYTPPVSGLGRWRNLFVILISVVILH
ncbi:MAG: hypothetical protein EAZ53_11240 [Bacteroidetes bacterium]|nr:MAG: hypothetical protein EAZ53_11240 [Bacteroidota bacterium]